MVCKTQFLLTRVYQTSLYKIFFFLYKVHVLISINHYTNSGLKYYGFERGGY